MFIYIYIYIYYIHYTVYVGNMRLDIGMANCIFLFAILHEEYCVLY